MEEQVERRIETFTENVVQVIGSGLSGATLRTVIEGLATRFALDVRRDATKAASVSALESQAMKPQEAEQAAPPITFEPPVGTPWGDEQPKPQAALTAQEADPT